VVETASLFIHVQFHKHNKGKTAKISVAGNKLKINK
jgi:hypothetical protein